MFTFSFAMCKFKPILFVRDFLPSLQNYFEEAIEQLAPGSGVEEEYRKVNNGEWGWRALRLMSRCGGSEITLTR